MRVDQQINRYKSREDYLAKKKLGAQNLDTVKDRAIPKKSENITDKADISAEAKEKAKLSKPSGNTPASGASTTASTATSAASSTSSKVTTALKNIPLPRTGGGGDEVNAVEKSEDKKVDGTAPRELKKPEPISTDLPKVINGPGIYFIKDMSLNPFHADSGGLEKMAENIPTAKVFSWDHKDEIIDIVKRHNTNQPILLIGHGLGGDTAVEIANELNDIEHGFRKIDLLVTLDSIGMNNDIIPQNVTQNLNIISDGDWFFNDGPNIARKTDRTTVVNELRSEPHNIIDDHPDVQFQIFDKINIVLGDAVAQRNVEKNRIRQLFREHGIQGVHR